MNNEFYICPDCRDKKLKQRNIKMRFGGFPSKIGKCELCGENNNELYFYQRLEDEE